MKLSALILTRNEEEVIEECLKQLDFVDEIIVLNQMSSDKTEQIAKKYTDKVFTITTEDFDKNRNHLAQLAKGEWILYVDADERFTPEAKGEINQATNQSEFVALYFPRKNFILGKWLKHGGWWPDYVPRLFKKENFSGWKGRVHESPQFKGEQKFAKHPINHYTARNMTKMLEKSTKWAKIEAQLYHEHQNSKVNIAKVIKFSTLEFLKRYIFKLGFLDGAVGFISSVYQGLHNAMILVYLWEIQTDAQNKFKQEKNR